MYLGIIQSALLLYALCPLYSFVQRRFGIGGGLVVIGSLSAAKIAYDIQESAQQNYYTLLEVQRHSSAMEIRAAYKRVSLKLHPDKNPSGEAEVAFQRVKHAYDVLMDEKSRDIYNRFGSAAALSSADPRSDELKLIADIGILYVAWGILSYLSTSSASSKLCRTWIALITLLVLVIEVSFLLTESQLPVWLGSATTEHQLLLILHSVLPCLAISLRSLAEFLYVDCDQSTVEVLLQLNLHQCSLQELLSQLEALATREQRNAGDTNEILSNVSSIRNAMNIADETAAAAVEKLKRSSTNPGHSYYWLVFVAIYGGVYLFQGEQ